MKASFLLVVALSTFTMPVFGRTPGGAFITGEQLQAKLQDFNTYYILENRSDPQMAASGLYGLGYVSGAFDALSRAGLICVPENVKFDQAEAVIMKYLQDHPEQWNESGADLAYYALGHAFPCAKVGH